jgi:hypothetical protein
MYVQANSLGTVDTVIVNKWVLVHDGKKVSQVLEADPSPSRIVTKLQVFVVDTKEAVDAEISRLKLKQKTHG